METNAGGRVIWSGDHTAFGETGGETGLEEERGKYAGHEYEAEVGLHSNARWYDAQTGRFITEDPAGDGVNWFAYVGNNPMSYLDPTGLSLLPAVIETGRHAVAAVKNFGVLVGAFVASTATSVASSVSALAVKTARTAAVEATQAQERLGDMVLHRITGGRKLLV
jgi:RHS repeat-associated protein